MTSGDNRVGSKDNRGKAYPMARNKAQRVRVE